MSELKTAEYDGKVCQVGAIYEFSDDCSNWTVDVLTGFTLGATYPISSIRASWVHIRECQLPIGTITDAPLKLEDGEWYVCATSGDNVIQCLYRYGEIWFYNSDRTSAAPDKEIKPLYKMVRA